MKKINCTFPGNSNDFNVIIVTKNNANLKRANSAHWRGKVHVISP